MTHTHRECSLSPSNNLVSSHLLHATLVSHTLPPHLLVTDYCIDGVCLLPPGAEAGHVCQPKPEAPAPTKVAAYKALRAMMRDMGSDAVVKGMERTLANHH